MSNRCISDLQRTTEFGVVDHIAVVVAKHDPETPQRGSRHLNTKLRNVALQKSRDVVVQPFLAERVVRGEEGARKAAAPPELLPVFGAYLIESKAAESEKEDASSQRFSALANKIP